MDAIFVVYNIELDPCQLAAGFFIKIGERKARNLKYKIERAAWFR